MYQYTRLILCSRLLVLFHQVHLHTLSHSELEPTCTHSQYAKQSPQRSIPARPPFCGHRQPRHSLLHKFHRLPSRGPPQPVLPRPSWRQPFPPRRPRRHGETPLRQLCQRQWPNGRQSCISPQRGQSQDARVFRRCPWVQPGELLGYLGCIRLQCKSLPSSPSSPFSFTPVQLDPQFSKQKQKPPKKPRNKILFAKIF